MIRGAIGYDVERRAGRVVVTCRACGTSSRPLTPRRALELARAAESPFARFNFGRCARIKESKGVDAERKRLARQLRAAVYLLGRERKIERRVGRARGKVGSDSSTRSGRGAVGRSSRQGSPVLLRARPTGRSRRAR